MAGVYEVAFYRGLPPASSAQATKLDWGYDFACLLAYSDGAYLQEAWDLVTSKRLFWDDAHVFVMIVRGSRQQSSFASSEPRVEQNQS